MRLQVVTGATLSARIPDVARLRIEVFREYPYLYDGSAAYEAQYLDTYTASGQAMAVLALDGDHVVGASTGIPMHHEGTSFREPLASIGLDPAQVFYCGESVLLPQWRGCGIYREFFACREHFARAAGGFAWMAFCAVVRPAAHPLRPRDWQPLDTVWRHFGYAPDPRLVTQYDWKDVDQPDSTAHTMQFWLKRLGAEKVSA